MRRVFRLALPALFLFAFPVSAQDFPGCSPNNANERICRSGNICVCRITGGSLSGFPQAFRWDCGIQNGGCIPGAFERTQQPYAGGQGGAPGPRATMTTTTATTVRAGSAAKAEIAQAQAALARLGYQTGPADGVVGPRTRAALQAYLAKEGLPSSDRITPEIYRRLVP